MTSRGPQVIVARLSALSTTKLVALTALAAFLLRYPGLLWPLRPDEAGYLLVARTWDPGPDSLYGPFWVDRPPVLFALIRASDWVGGPYFLRLVAALGCALTVVAAARTAYLIAGERAARWAALAATAVTVTTLLDSVAAKGEILGLPLVVGSFWCTLEGLRLFPRSRGTALLLAFGAGLLGALALGLKQNMATGLVFGGVVLLVSALRSEITWRAFAALFLAALAGVAVPVAAVIGWTLSVGADLDMLWYSVYGFRGDAIEVISSEQAAAPRRRAFTLLLISVVTGTSLVICTFLAYVGRAWQTRPAVAAGAVAVVMVDGLGIVLGASYWRAYLFNLVPAVILCTALLAARPGRSGRVMRWCVRWAAISCAVSSVGWAAVHLYGAEPPNEHESGAAIAEVAEDGDTIVVFGGRADIVLRSGLDTPYPYLWSLLMRTLDPELERMTGLLRSEDAPTWFVGWVPFDAWDDEADPGLQAALDERYREVGDVCDGRPVWVRADVQRDAPEPLCDRPWPFGLLNP